MSSTLQAPEVTRVELAQRAGSRRRTRALSRLGIVGIVLAVAIGFLVFKTVTSAVVYFKTAQQAIASRASLGDSTFQIEGIVDKGTIRRAPGGAVTSFVISSGAVKVQVDNDAPEPALFQANIPVVLVGHFVGSSDRYQSDQILVKHSNSYIAAHPNRVKAPNGTVR